MLSGTSLKMMNSFSRLVSILRIEATFPHLFYLSKPVEVVGRGPNSHQTLLGEPVLIPFLHQLMRPADQRQLVQIVEVLHHLLPESHPITIMQYIRCNIAIYMY